MSVTNLIRPVRAAAAFIVLLLAGCAGQPQAPLSLEQTFYSDKEHTVGVYMQALPQPNLTLPGAGCLLCIAAAAAMNSGLSAHVKTFSVAELAEADDKVATALDSKGMKVKLIETPIELRKLGKVQGKASNSPKLDFRPLRAQLGVDYLYVIAVEQLGGTRTYANYIPTSAPSASLVGTVYLVDLQTNEYRLYETLNLKQFADGEWDEPKYPGITNAYYQTIATAVDQIVRTVAN